MSNNTDSNEQGETLEMPPRVYIQLMNVSPELQNNDGAWYVLEDPRASVAAPTLRDQVVDEWHRACHVNANIEPREEFDFGRLAGVLFAVMDLLRPAVASAPSSASPVRSKSVVNFEAWTSIDQWLRDNPSATATECLAELVKRIKVEAAPAQPEGEGERRLLTSEELNDIERFQRQRRKNPVTTDAWLYVAEIDRLLTHIRVDREQLENEIFQDAADPDFATNKPPATPVARETAAKDIAEWAFKLEKPLTSETDLRVAQSIVDGILSKHFPATAAPSETPPNHALVQLLDAALLHPDQAEGKIRQVIEALSATSETANGGEARKCAKCGHDNGVDENGVCRNRNYDSNADAPNCFCHGCLCRCEFPVAAAGDDEGEVCPHCHSHDCECSDMDMSPDTGAKG